MSLGLESGTVRVVPYDAAWPELFVIEANRLYERFARQKLAIVIEHTGSTAVPGLAAKPILDILAGRPEGELVQPYVRTLIGADYVHRGEQEIPGRDFFRRGQPRAYHVHLTTIGSNFWQDHLAFRDRLRADSSLRDRYADLKRELAARFPRDREAYISGKASFVKEVLRNSAPSSVKPNTR
jgi:GrpB-like predicted nucleotidyltransferase (UPF0157 family)